jgi:hypothetical protein
LNPDRTRSDEDLPIVDWEVVSERRVVPIDIVIIMGASSPIVRVDQDTARKQVRKHRGSIEQWNAFNDVIQNWEWWRKQHADEARNNAYERWRFVQRIVDDTAPDGWPLLTVLEKQPDGSIKLITSHRRRASFWDRVECEGYARRGEE